MRQDAYVVFKNGTQFPLEMVSFFKKLDNLESGCFSTFLSKDEVGCIKSMFTFVRDLKLGVSAILVVGDRKNTISIDELKYDFDPKKMTLSISGRYIVFDTDQLESHSEDSSRFLYIGTSM